MSWSDGDKPDKSVRDEVLPEIQKLADAADVDLTLSSGRRSGLCYLTSSNGKGSMHNCGLAVDISQINGVDVGQGVGPAAYNKDADPLVRRVVGAARNMSSVRENIGPIGMWLRDKPGGAWVQFYTPAVQQIHYNHVHIGIYPR